MLQNLVPEIAEEVLEMDTSDVFGSEQKLRTHTEKLTTECCVISLQQATIAENIHPNNKDNNDKMGISCEGNQESTLTTNTQEKRQRGGADDVDIQQVDRGNSGH
jgi:hypothetical protein